MFFDRNAFRPLAVAYREVPQPVRASLRNLLQNLDSPATFVNDVLRGRIAPAGITLQRLAVNSTVGIGGLFDVADGLGLKAHYDDFGKTLAAYGVDDGPYLFFILLGPTNLRDLTESVVDFLLNPFIFAGWTDWSFAIPGDLGFNFLDTRQQNLELSDRSSAARSTSTQPCATPISSIATTKSGRRRARATARVLSRSALFCTRATEEI